MAMVDDCRPTEDGKHDGPDECGVRRKGRDAEPEKQEESDADPRQPEIELCPEDIVVRDCLEIYLQVGRVLGQCDRIRLGVEVDDVRLVEPRQMCLPE